jgi:DnaJ-class molecular chaperone
MLVSLRGSARESYSDVDLDGKPLPLAARVTGKTTHAGFREPWITLADVHGSFRAKDLCCGACGGHGTRRDIPTRFQGTSTCPECAGASR